jgi:hypothetical protein
VKGPGRRVPADYRITRYSPLRELAFQISAGPGPADWTLPARRSRAEPTTVTFSLDLKPPDSCG